MKRLIMRASDIISQYRPAYFAIWVQSIFSALLAICPFIYVMQVSERVLTSFNWDTLLFLTLLIVALMLVWAALDYFRMLSLRALGHQIEQSLRDQVYDAVHRSDRPEAFRAWSDIATLKQGLTGPLMAAAMDASLTPLFILVLFVLHPVFGFAAIGYVVILALVSARAKSLAAEQRARSQPDEDRAFAFGLSTARKREVVRAMDLLSGTRRIWGGLQRDLASNQLAGALRLGPIELIVAFIGQMQLVLMVGLGAVLCLQGAVSASVGMAAFIVMGRGVGPILALVRNLPVLAELRAASLRLQALLNDPLPRPSLALPPMQGALSCQDLALMGRDGQPVISGVRFGLPAGAICAVIGPSGAGKSSLLRMLAGAVEPNAGQVVIDGFPLSQWPDSQRGESIGYLPQSVDLLPGTILENVTRFRADGAARVPDVTTALRLAGALEIVQCRGRGLEFRLNDDGMPLSGGQRQRIGLARAFFGAPKLLILDEPDAALDAAGDKHLSQSLSELSRAGGTIIFSTHKMNMLDFCDYILVVMNGFMHSFSPRDEMMGRLAAGRSGVISDLREAAE